MGKFWPPFLEIFRKLNTSPLIKWLNKVTKSWVLKTPLWPRTKFKKLSTTESKISDNQLVPVICPQSLVTEQDQQIIIKNIYDEGFLQKSLRLKGVNYIPKVAPTWMFKIALNTYLWLILGIKTTSLNATSWEALSIKENI